MNSPEEWLKDCGGNRPLNTKLLFLQVNLLYSAFQLKLTTLAILHVLNSMWSSSYLEHGIVSIFGHVVDI